MGVGINDHGLSITQVTDDNKRLAEFIGFVWSIWFISFIWFVWFVSLI